VLQWNKVQQVPHLELCNFIQRVPPLHEEHKRRKCVLIPRDCYKSTVGSKSLPLWILIQDDFCGSPGIEHRILLGSASSENSQKNIRSLKQQVEKNNVLQWLFPEIIPDLSRTTWTDDALLFPRKGVYGENTIECAGIDTHLVSRHYTVMIFDDLEDDKSMESPSVRRRVLDWYRASEALFVNTREGYLLVIGTRWGIDDLYYHIIKEEKDFFDFLVRPLHWTREELDSDARRVSQGEEPVYAMDPVVHAPDPSKTYYYFPELFPEESCRRVRAKQGSFMYSMLFLNNPRDPALAEFKEKDLRYYSFDDEGNLVLDLEGETEVVSYDSLRRVLFWDPALSEKEQKKNARNAIVVFARDHRGRFFLLDAFADWKNPAMLFSKYIGMHQRWRCHRAAVEDVAFQRVLKFPLYQVMKELDYHFAIEDAHPIGDKHARIRTLLPLTEQHIFFMNKTGIGHRQFREEMLGFPVFPTVDLLDAAAAARTLLGLPYVSQNTRDSKRAISFEARRFSSRSAITGY